jgi:hypothetical protein
MQNLANASQYVLLQVLQLHAAIEGGAMPFPVFFGGTATSVSPIVVHISTPQVPAADDFIGSSRFSTAPRPAESVLCPDHGTATPCVDPLGGVLVPPEVTVTLDRRYAVGTVSPSPAMTPVATLEHRSGTLWHTLTESLHLTRPTAAEIATGAAWPELVSVAVSAPSQELHMVDYCLGKKRYSIAGLPVERLRPGSKYCDDLMNRVCTNTAFTYDTRIARACSCLWEQETMRQQLQKWSLPVQCVSDICSDEGTDVYRTGAMRGTPCTAKVCEQALTLQGSGIVYDGYQSLTCNSTIYDVRTAQPQLVVDGSEQPLAIDQSTPALGEFQLDSSFYAGLGMLALLLLLLFIWMVRKYMAYRSASSSSAPLTVLPRLDSTLTTGPTPLLGV